MVVRGGPFGDGRIHIGDPYQQTQGAIRKFFQVFHLVQIPRAVVVDRRPQQRTQVPDRRTGNSWRSLFESLHFTNHVRRKVRLESRFKHRLMRAGLEIERDGRHTAMLL